MGTNWRALNAEDKTCDLQMNLKMSRDCTAELRAQNAELVEALEEVSTHLGSIEAIIKCAIEIKPSRCILTDKYDGICPHCESDTSWLNHELKAHGDYSKAINKALAKAKG